MSMLPTATPFPQFFDLDGQPLDGGSVYYGLPNQNPETSPITVYWDLAGTQPAAQPIKTLNGYPVRNGSVARIFCNQEYSMTVKNRFSQLVFSAATSNDFDEAAIVRGDLSSTSDAAKGAGMIGLNQALAYGADTVGGFLRGLNHISKYGTLHNDGTTDDAAVFQAAAASGDKIIDARGVNCLIGSAINITSGQVWLLQGASLSFASSTQTVFNADTVTDWALLGSFKITGDGSTIGTAKAIRIKDCSCWLVDAPNISNVKGWGVYIEPGTSTTARATHGTLRNPIIYNCYYGYEDSAGTGAEYCTILNPRIYGCAQFGLRTCAGNTLVNGGHIVDNTLDGVQLGAGGNHGHGCFTGVNINHNGQYGIKATQVTNGFSFTGCHIYQNDVWLDRCNGITIDGGHLDARRIYNDTGVGSGYNYIRNMYCPGAYGPTITSTNSGENELVIEGCTGAGAHAFSGSTGPYAVGVTINDPNTVYVQANRNAAANQSLTSGVAATLIFPSSVFDRRLAYNTATGTFTVPSGQGGMYRIKGGMLFGGTSMSATASFLEIKINGTAKFLCLPSIYSTTKLSICANVEILLAAGDAITLVGTITGTTPVFGDGSYASMLSIERIA